MFFKAYVTSIRKKERLTHFETRFYYNSKQYYMYQGHQDEIFPKKPTARFIIFFTAI